MHPDAPEADLVVLGERLSAAGYCLPSFLTLHPTNKCNHHCPWCWFDRTAEQVNIAHLLETLSSIEMGGVPEVIVSGGGEPLLHPRIETLFDFLRDHRPRQVKLYTHGGLLSRYSQAIAATFDYVRLSLDAGDTATYERLHGGRPGAFDKLFDDAAALASAEVKVGVSMVVTMDNRDGIPYLMDRCAASGISSVLLKPMMTGMRRASINQATAKRWSAIGSGVDVAVRTEPSTPMASVLPLPDRVATASITVVPDGRVLPCCHLIDEQWTISDVGRPVDDVFVTRHRSVASQYARSPHPCRVHDAWRRHEIHDRDCRSEG